MIVVALVVLGVGDEMSRPDVHAAPTKLPIRSEDDTLPVAIQAQTIQMWLTVNQENGPFSPGRRDLVRALAGKHRLDEPNSHARDHARFLGGKMEALTIADVAAIAAEKPLPVAAGKDLLTALNELEKAGRYDHLWNAYLWRKSETATFADAAARIELYARLRQHARITDAFIRAQAQVRPMMVMPRAWGSKVGPRPGERKAMQAYAASLADMVKVAAEVLPSTDEGTWKRDGVASIKPVTGSPAPVLVRAGKERVLAENESARFGRLDLLKTGDQPAVINHDWLGKIELPANKLISVWELPDLLPDAARRKLDETVLDAIKNNSEEASDRLERCLAISHRAIRIGLKELPFPKGAPRLRLILALFDDTLMPILPMTNGRNAASGFDDFGDGGIGDGGGGRGPGGR